MQYKTTLCCVGLEMIILAFSKVHLQIEAYNSGEMLHVCGSLYVVADRRTLLVLPDLHSLGSQRPGFHELLRQCPLAACWGTAAYQLLLIPLLLLTIIMMINLIYKASFIHENAAQTSAVQMCH